MRTPRIIPTTIAFASLFFIVKIMDVVRGSELLFVSDVRAQQEGKEAAKKEEPKKEEPKKEDVKKEEVKSEEGGKKEGEAKPAEPAKKEDGAKKEEPAASHEGGGEEKKEKSNPNVSDTPGTVADRSVSGVEMELLKNLSKRREELDRWESNIQIKESALDATEKRINDKIQQIDDMKKEVSALLAQYNSQEDSKIKSLVKIYENMKPSDAARIFDELEMPILLLVVDKMSEKKAAPILAAMNPKKAKQVTVELAQQRRANSSRINSGTPTPVVTQ